MNELLILIILQQGICKMYVEKKKSTEEEGMLGDKDKADDE